MANACRPRRRVCAERLRSNRAWLGVLATVWLAGCALEAPNPRFTLRYEKGNQDTNLTTLISRAGPGPVSVIDLGRTAWVSHHLAVVRDAEVPHYHRFHDLTVVVMRGDGVIDIDGKPYAMHPGDVVHVQRGVRHFFRNTGSSPAAAFVTFSPPFDGRDTVVAEIPPSEQPLEPPKRGWWPFRRGSSTSKTQEAKPPAAEEKPASD